MTTKTLTVQSLQETAENWAQRCQVFGHHPLHQCELGWMKGMNSILLLTLVLTGFALGCGSSSSAGGGGGGNGTSMLGTWTVTGSLTNPDAGPVTYTVALVSSPCSVTTPVGMFPVQGPVCFTANNNSGQGSISGAGGKGTSQGVLVGVAANPVPDGGAFSLTFVAGEQNGTFAEFTGTGTVTKATLTGTASCSSASPVCQGTSGTFKGNQE